jgi:hypothetical protein
MFNLAIINCSKIITGDKNNIIIKVHLKGLKEKLFKLNTEELDLFYAALDTDCEFIMLKEELGRAYIISKNNIVGIVVECED